MVVADFSGDFVNKENVKEGDKVVIDNEGEYVEQEFSGKKRVVLQIPVKINDTKLKIFTPSMGNGKLLQQAWGNDTKAWVGKQLKPVVVNYKSYGETKQTVELHPVK